MRRFLRGAIVSFVLATRPVAADDGHDLSPTGGRGLPGEGPEGVSRERVEGEHAQAHHPGLLYNVACARSLGGDAAGALKA